MPWQLVTAPSALAAAVAVGVLAAVLLPSPWIVPGVLLVMFLSHRVFYWEGYPELFTLEMATWVVAGARPIPGHLMATVVLNVVTFVGSLAGLHFLTAPAGVRPRWAPLVVVAMATLAAAVYVPFVVAGVIDTYELLP